MAGHRGLWPSDRSPVLGIVNSLHLDIADASCQENLGVSHFCNSSWVSHWYPNSNGLVLTLCRLLPIVICRLYYLSPTEKHAHSTGTVASILTEAAVAYAFFSASVTCLKPFLQPFHSGYVISMVGARISGHTVTGTDSQGDSYHMLGNTRSAMDKNGTAVTISDAAGSRNSQAVEDTHWLRAPLFRPDQSNHQATVETKYRHHNSNNPEEMIISMTHEWTVSYEDNQHPAATKK